MPNSLYICNDANLTSSNSTNSEFGQIGHEQRLAMPTHYLLKTNKHITGSKQNKVCPPEDRADVARPRHPSQTMSFIPRPGGQSPRSLAAGRARQLGEPGAKAGLERVASLGHTPHLPFLPRPLAVPCPPPSRVCSTLGAAAWGSASSPPLPRAPGQILFPLSALDAGRCGRSWSPCPTTRSSCEGDVRRRV